MRASFSRLKCITTSEYDCSTKSCSLVACFNIFFVKHSSNNFVGCFVSLCNMRKLTYMLALLKEDNEEIQAEFEMTMNKFCIFYF